jgi:hypothetical protein
MEAYLFAAELHFRIAGNSSRIAELMHTDERRTPGYHK